MFENMNESEARQQILKAVGEYCDKYHNNKTYKPGDRISYASRVYDKEEMTNLVDSSLEFGLHREDIPVSLKRSLQNILMYAIAHL